MEDKILSGYAKVEESDYEITGNLSQLSNIKTSESFQQESAYEDILLGSFAEEEIFILSEEYVRMEGEYVMWQGTTSHRSKSREKERENDYEGQLMLPFEDSLQSLSEYFTLTVNRPVRCN